MVQVPSRRQKLRIEPVGLGGRFAHAGERGAGFDRDGVGDRIDLADFRHAVERQHDLVVETGSVRRPDRYCRPAARSAVRVSFASFRICETCSVVSGRSTSGRGADPAVAHLVQIGRLQVRIGQRVFLADDRAEAGDQVLVRLEHGYFYEDEFGFDGRGAAARIRRSLMASPSPSDGIGITAMPGCDSESSRRR